MKPKLTVVYRKPKAGSGCSMPILPDCHPCGLPAVVTVERSGNGLWVQDCYCERHALGRKPA